LFSGYRLPRFIFIGVGKTQGLGVCTGGRRFFWGGKTDTWVNVVWRFRGDVGRGGVTKTGCFRFGEPGPRPSNCDPPDRGVFQWARAAVTFCGPPGWEKSRPGGFGGPPAGTGVGGPGNAAGAGRAKFTARRFERNHRIALRSRRQSGTAGLRIFLSRGGPVGPGAEAHPGGFKARPGGPRSSKKGGPPRPAPRPQGFLSFEEVAFGQRPLTTTGRQPLGRVDSVFGFPTPIFKSGVTLRNPKSGRIGTWGLQPIQPCQGLPRLGKLSGEVYRAFGQGGIITISVCLFLLWALGPGAGWGLGRGGTMVVFNCQPFSQRARPSGSGSTHATRSFANCC